MNAERWREVERLFHAALEQHADQGAWLAAACAGDESLRREVQSLLQYQDQAERFIESPALELAARLQSTERAPAAVPGQTLNQYRITSLLGAGGTGEVYLAWDTRLHRNVALKLLAVDFTRDLVQLRRFELEALAIAALSHPNVCAIHEVIEIGEGRSGIVMEHVEGITLRQRLVDRPMRVAEAVDVAIQIASALAAAHAAGIVHRDIKPENILLRGDGYVKVLDFGLAKLAERRIDDAHVSTEAGTVLGTLGYLSPERARGLPVDPRTDIWSLGVVLFEMLAGKQPFTGPRATDVLLAIAERDPSPLATHRPEVPRRLDDIVRKALAKDPQRRYASANDFLAELKTVSQQLQSTTIESGPGAEEGHVLFHADREILLTEGENIVGRDSAARVRLVSGSVSRAHAAIVVTGNSATVADLQSKNGTFVNGERIDSVRLLRHGMTLRCGTVELVYRRGHPVTESIDEE